MARCLKRSHWEEANGPKAATALTAVIGGKLNGRQPRLLSLYLRAKSYETPRWSPTDHTISPVKIRSRTFNVTLVRGSGRSWPSNFAPVSVRSLGHILLRQLQRQCCNALPQAGMMIGNGVGNRAGLVGFEHHLQ